LSIGCGSWYPVDDDVEVVDDEGEGATGGFGNVLSAVVPEAVRSVISPGGVCGPALLAVVEAGGGTTGAAMPVALGGTGGTAGRFSVGSVAATDEPDDEDGDDEPAGDVAGVAGVADASAVEQVSTSTTLAFLTAPAPVALAEPED